MFQSVTTFAVFIAIGIAWRYLKPMKITAEELQSILITLLYTVLLPALVLSTMWQANLNANTWRILLAMLVTSVAAIAAAWFYYKYRGKNISSSVKASFILAAAFGSILIIGMPVTQDWVAPWTKRTAVFFEALIMMPLLFTVGIMIAKKLSGERNSSISGKELVKEPIIIAAILGLALNLTNISLPTMVAIWMNTAIEAILPIGLIAVGVSVYWKKQWHKLLPVMWPVAVIQLVLAPVLLWASFHLFSVYGVQTFRSMLLQAAMPSMLLGFVICERYRLDTMAYTAAFSMTVIASVITIPTWWWLIQQGYISH